MGKNKKNKNASVEKEVKNVVVEEVKKEEAVEEIESVSAEVNEKTEKELKKENKNKVKELKKENKEKEKALKKENKEKLKEAKKQNIEKNDINKELIKKAKKANNDTKIIIGMIVVVLLIAFGIFGFYFYKLNSENVATFDGGKVSAADYEVYYKTFAPMLEYYGYPASIIPEQIANKAALDKIIVEMAEAAGVTVSEENKAEVEEIFKDEEQLATFRDQGIDIGRMRKLYMNDYLISAYLDKLAEEANDEDVINYLKTTYSQDENLDLNQYNTSHILFKTQNENGEALSDADKAAKKSQAEAALARVLKGEDFATVAKELSEDEGTKEDGGKYVMYADGSTVEEYEKAVKALKVGEITAALVETDYGYHIIKLDSKVENGRAKNETERDEYVDYKVNALAEERHLEIDNEALNILIEKITGTKPNTETEETLEGVEGAETAAPVEGENTEASDDANAEKTAE